MTTDSPSFDAQSFLKGLTQRPGIYQMLGENGAILYIGKAKNLRKRVASYFSKTGLSIKTQALVNRIITIDVTVTQTEIEALLLEQNLIKQNLPPYNILLRDDKSYPYIFLSDQDKYPQLAFHRGSKRRLGSYFGPFPSVQAVRESMSFLQKTFKVRQCEDSFFKNRTRPCLQYQIKRCTAPCVDLVTPESYHQDVDYTKMFLEGKSDNLIKKFEVEMDWSSKNLNFEHAAILRDQITALRKIQAEQVVESGNKNIDIVAASQDGSQGCIHILYIRQGRILGSRTFYPRVPLATSPGEILEHFIPQYYLRDGGKGDFPKEIVVNAKLDDSELFASAVSSVAGYKIEFKCRSRAIRKKWIELAEQTANQNLKSLIISKQNLLQKFEALQKLLNLQELPGRLECFDISHSSGEATVASCVVFDTNGPLKSDYRRFNIKDITAGDDYAAMEQALTRRYKRLQKGEEKLPDILLIDGGLGQLKKAANVLEELGVIGVEIVGVGKGRTRKSGFETLLLAPSLGSEGIIDAKNDYTELVLESDSAALLLIQQIRDEAHRFAITGHRQRRDKKRKTSSLEEIEGVGPKRRRELLRFFGDINEVKRASVAEL
ncbi:MAG: excinuclease ABC subunit UvrC, partial [Porticoccus sp.]|nr:excinuclease ABC subunit UvrC [Porticoccus sp.]